MCGPPNPRTKHGTSVPCPQVNVAGALLPTGINAEIQPAIVTDLKSIQAYVGGTIDAVRHQLENDTVIVGYCHDEGLLLDMEMNWFASALFGQELRGPVVLVSGTSPQGEYDGDNYDLPHVVYDYLTTQFTTHVANTYNEAMLMSVALATSLREGIIDKSDVKRLSDAMDHAAETGDTSEFVAVLGEFEKRVDEEIVVRDAKQLISEAEEFLNGGK